MDGALAVFFETGRTYRHADGREFLCVAVSDAPLPGAVGHFAFGFEIARGKGRLNRWLPAVETDLGRWTEAL